MSKLSFKPIKKNYRLCSLKQFVGNGKLQIDENTIQFSSKSVEVLVEMENGEKYKLFCDTFVSNGIKTEYINEEFLLNEELFFELNVPNYKTNCCVYYLNKKLVISFDKNAFDLGEDYYDFIPIIEPGDIRFENENFLILCSVTDYISSFGGFYQNKKDIREFVLTRFENDPSPVRILCSQELEFQLKNGKNPKDLLNHYIAVFKSNNGESYLRIFDATKIESKPWYKFSATLFIINEVMKNPYQYSFVNLKFNKTNYLKIN